MARNHISLGEGRGEIVHDRTVDIPILTPMKMVVGAHKRDDHPCSRFVEIVIIIVIIAWKWNEDGHR